jgi:hypothetical protein
VWLCVCCCLSKNTWSADEVGISGLGTSDVVVASRYARRVYQQQTTKDHCTLMACYCTTGACIPPLFLFKGKRVGQGILEGAPPGSGVQVNESAWMTEELFYQWLQFFADSIPPARPALLIVDNHESRFSLRIIERCVAQQITLLLLPPNATHLLQVGDVAVHAPFKKALRNQVGVFLHEHPRTTITKYHYTQIIAPAYTLSFSAANIQAGYKATGIYPFAPSKVQNRLPSFVPSTSTPIIPLAEILSIPGQIQQKPSTPRKKRAGMPATRILTSVVMQDYFEQQQRVEKEKMQQKEERKRKRASKKEEKAAQPKRKYRRKQPSQVEEPDKENESLADDDVVEGEADSDYCMTSALAASASSSSARPSRNAAEWARTQMCIASQD